MDAGSDIRLSDSSKRLLRRAFALARGLRQPDRNRSRILQWFAAGAEWIVDPRHILIAIQEERGFPTEELRVSLFRPEAAAPATKMLTGIPETARARLSEKLRAALLCARYESARLGAGAVRPEHLLLGLAFGAPKTTAERLGSIRALRQRVSEHRSSADGEPATLCAEARQVIQQAAEEAGRLGHNRIGTAHLLWALLRAAESFPTSCANRLDIDLQDLQKELAETTDLP